MITAPAVAQGNQCTDFLQASTGDDGDNTLTPKYILHDLASRLGSLMSQLGRNTYIKTDRLRFMKAMVLETTALNDYYGKLYAHAFPDQTDIIEGFKERQGFLEALNLHVSSIAKYRDLEKWLLEAQTESQKSGDSAKVNSYQVIRDELNLIYYAHLADLHDQLLGEKNFHFERPMPWKDWFSDYVSFIESLPGLDQSREQEFLLGYLLENFRTLHEQMSELKIEGMERNTPQEVEVLVHDIRRRIRGVNIILLKNSQLIRLQEVEHDWLELDNSVIEGAMASTAHDSRYIKLNPTAPAEPILFPQLSFYAIYFFTGELGSIKDHLEQVLFLEEIRLSLREKIKRDPSPSYEQGIKLAIKLATTHSLSKRSRDFLKVIKESYLFLYTASWLKEFNLKY